MRSTSAESRLMHSGSPGFLEATLQFESYFHLYTRIYRTLVDDYDEAEARKTIEEDFINDAKGDDVITMSEFGDALVRRSARAA